MKKVIYLIIGLILLSGCSSINYPYNEYYDIYWHETELSNYLVEHKTDIGFVHSSGRGELEWTQDGKNYAIVCRLYPKEDMKRCCREGEVRYINGNIEWINITYETPYQTCW